MKPIERFQALLDGKKIRKIDWLASEYVSLRSNGNFVDGLLHVFCGTDADIRLLIDPNEAWELYEEPKPEIKLTPDMIGRKVRLKNGSIRMITAWDGCALFLIGIVWYFSNGTKRTSDTTSDMLSVVEILPENKWPN